MKRHYHFRNMDDSITKKVLLVERNPIPNGVQLVSVKAVGKRAPNDLVELASHIQKADEFVCATTCSKLQVIAEQVKFLQNQAKNILMEAKRNTDLHHVACNFKKIAGNTYYLYKRPTGQKYFSMLSPQEWTGHPHAFLGGYRLEADHSWTPEEEILKKNDQNMLLDKIMSATQNSVLSYALEDNAMET